MKNRAVWNIQQPVYRRHRRRRRPEFANKKVKKLTRGAQREKKKGDAGSVAGAAPRGLVARKLGVSLKNKLSSPSFIFNSFRAIFPAQ